MNLVTIKQPLASNPIADIRSAVRAQLDALGLDPPRGEVAITAGSRGIANIPLILRTCGGWLRERGATPFVVPAMGSHNGGTADGQQAMLESLGMTEAALDMPIHASMDTIKLGEVPTGAAAMDRIAHEAAGVLVVNRIKLHTSFGGPPYGKHCESGLAKMITVGLGKIDAAKTFHTASTRDKPATLNRMAQLAIDSGKIWAGLAILEDGYDQTAELHALAAGDILTSEPALLARYAEHYFPQLPVDNLNVLVVEQIGKNFSGTGMDTNVIGRHALNDAPFPDRPKIGGIAALELSPQSHGNAMGIGMADVITQRLYDAVDFDKSRLNAQTACEPSIVDVPLVLPDDQAVLAWLEETYGSERWMIAPNTLELGEVRVSEDLVEEIQESFLD